MKMPASKRTKKKNASSIKQQCSTYQNLVRIRLHLQKYATYLARWPHPWLLRSIRALKLPPEENIEEDITEIQDKLSRLCLQLCGRLVPIKQLQIDKESPFDCFDPLSQRREVILERLDHWNQRTNLKVDSSFEVLNKSISSQIRYFLDNRQDFLKKARPTNVPENIIGYDILKQKLGLQECRKAVISELYNDQLFYVQLLRFATQAGEADNGNLREEELLLRNDQSDKPRMSVSKTSKARRIRYTVIDKLQNFVERTRKKASTSPEVVDLLIRSLFKN